MPNFFKFKIRHEYKGRSKGDPFASPLTADTIDRHLSSLRAMLPEGFSTSIKDHSLFVEIVTDDSEDAIKNRLARPVVELNNANSGLCFVIDKL